VKVSYISYEELTELESHYGRPAEPELSAPFPMQLGEWTLLRESQHGGRAHDATLFIFIAGKIVAIRKPFHPPGVYRPPSGVVPPGEPINHRDGQT